MRKLLYMLALALYIAVPYMSSEAQPFSDRKKYWTIGGSLNSMQYFGDLVPKPGVLSADLKFTKPQFGVLVQRRFHPRMAWRGAFAVGRLKGDDQASANPNDADQAVFRWKRNLHFRNDIAELSGSIVLDLFENRREFYRRRDWIPYITAGIGVFTNNPKAARAFSADSGGVVSNTWDLSKPTSVDWTPLRKIKTEGQEKAYSPIAVCVPLGLGIRYKLSNKLDLEFEVAYRWTFTDYIDDVSGYYKGPDELTDEQYAYHDRSRQQGARSEEDIKKYYNTVDANLISVSGGQVTIGYNSGAVPAGAEQVTSASGQKFLVFSGYGVGGPKNSSGNEIYKNRRGNPNDKDIYLVTGFHLSYIFGAKVKCPKFR